MDGPLRPDVTMRDPEALPAGAGTARGLSRARSAMRVARRAARIEAETLRCWLAFMAKGEALRVQGFRCACAS